MADTLQEQIVLKVELINVRSVMEVNFGIKMMEHHQLLELLLQLPLILIGHCEKKCLIT